MASVIAAPEDAPRIQTTERKALPYEPGWVDRVIEGIRRLPGPSWVFYLSLWLLLFCILTLILWTDGASPVGTFFPFHAVIAGIYIYSLAMIHYLKQVSGAALDDFRPALETSDSDFASLRYQLTTMPARATLVASVVGLVMGVVAPTIVSANMPGLIHALKIGTSPVATVLEMLGALFAFSTFSVMFFGGLRKLRLVNQLYITAPHLDLFRPSPLYAFAGLSARTAIAIVVVPYAVLVSAVSVWDIPAAPLFVLPQTLVATIIFLGPLVGVHRILEKQKRHLQDDVGQRLGVANIDLQRRMDAKEFSDMTGLKDGIESLVAVQNELSKLRTWPWKAGTVSGLAVALFLPIVIWGIQRLLERLGF